MKATIYSPSSRCPKCELTKSKLNIEQEHLVATEKEIEKFKELGYLSFPIVYIKDVTGTIVDEWCDFRFDKIKGINDKTKDTLYNEPYLKTASMN